MCCFNKVNLSAILLAHKRIILHLVGFLSLHTLLTMHGHRNLKLPVRHTTNTWNINSRVYSLITSFFPFPFLSFFFSFPLFFYFSLFPSLPSLSYIIVLSLYLPIFYKYFSFFTYLLSIYTYVHIYPFSTCMESYRSYRDWEEDICLEVQPNEHEKLKV